MADLGPAPRPGGSFEVGAVREAWLFTRGQKSVRIVRATTRSRMFLYVLGPDTELDMQEFADVTACMRYQGELERRLVGEGFSLDRSVSDRRSGTDRRAMARGADRRRLTVTAPEA